jgi:L-fuculose-phosphate aldolase
VDTWTVKPVAVVRRDDDEFPGGECVLEVRSGLEPALRGIEPGDRLQVMWWMHRLDEKERQTLQCHPMGDRSRPKRGVFALRSPMRPNPIGSSVVEVLQVGEDRVVVEGLDAFDRSPVVDIKIAHKN